MFLLALLRERLAERKQDLLLVAGTTARDQLAFGKLYDRYAPLVFTLILRIIRSAEETEEIVQEVFLQIWKKSGLFSAEKGSVYTWIMTIARHKAIDHLRARRGPDTLASLEESPELSLPDGEYLADPLNAAITSEHEAFMREGMEALSADQRAILELSYYEGYSQSEIAERLNMPLGTVKTRMRLALKKLRDHLKERLRQ